MNHDFVDLGLPSGTLWATCNVGANSPEEYGDYFAWGEYGSKYNYDWDTYLWHHGQNELTKYSTDDYFGIVDNKRDLELIDDAAYMKWDNKWQIPSRIQCAELIKLCTWTWTTQNKINGCIVTGLNKSRLFLPAAGYRDGRSFISIGELGCYWSNTLGLSYMLEAFSLILDSDKIRCGYDDVFRHLGRSIRPVRRLL